MTGKTGKARQMIDRSKVGVRMKRDSRLTVKAGQRGLVGAAKSARVNPAIKAVSGKARLSAVKNAIGGKQAAFKAKVMASRAPKAMAAAPKAVTGGIKAKPMGAGTFGTTKQFTGVKAPVKATPPPTTKTPPAFTTPYKNPGYAKGEFSGVKAVPTKVTTAQMQVRMKK